MQGQSAQIGIENFWPNVGAHAVFLLPGPQAAANAGFGAASTARPLRSASQRNPFRHQPCEAACRIKARQPCKAAVYHQPHAFDGQRGFCNGCGKHHLALPCGGGCYGRVLLAGREVAVQRAQRNIGGKFAFQQICKVANFTRTRQKGQQAALVCLHQMRNNVGHVPPQQGASPGVCGPANHLPRAQRGRYVPHLYRVYLALAEHRGAAAQKFGHRRHIQCGRHDNQPQIGAQRRLTFKAKGQTRIGYERTLVKFVKNNAGNVRQVGVFLQHAGQHAFGYNFHTGVATHAAFVAHAVAHKPAGLFAKQGSHIARQCASGHAPGF